MQIEVSKGGRLRRFGEMYLLFLSYPLRPSEFISRRQGSVGIAGNRIRLQPLVLASAIIASQVVRIVKTAKVLGTLPQISSQLAAERRIATIYGLILIATALVILLRAPGVLANTAASSLLLFFRDKPVDFRVTVSARLCATATMVLAGALPLLIPLVVITAAGAKFSALSTAAVLVISAVYLVMLVGLQYGLVFGVLLPISQSRVGAKLISGLNLVSFVVLVGVLTASAVLFSSTTSMLGGLGDRFATWMSPLGLITTAPWTIEKILTGDLPRAIIGAGAVAMLCAASFWLAVTLGQRSLGFIYENPVAASSFRLVRSRLVVDQTRFERTHRVRAKNIQRWLGLPKPLAIAGYLAAGAGSWGSSAATPIARLGIATFVGIAVVAAAESPLARQINLPASHGAIALGSGAVAAMMAPGVALSLAGRVRGDGYLIRRFFAPLPVSGAAVAQAYLIQSSLGTAPYLAIAYLGAMAVLAKAAVGVALVLGLVSAMLWVGLAGVAVTGGLIFPHLDASDSAGARSPGLVVSVICYGSSIVIFGSGALMARYVVEHRALATMFGAIAISLAVALSGWVLARRAGGRLASAILADG